MRASLGIFGPPEACNPFDTTYNSCVCKNVFKTCTSNWPQCFDICQSAQKDPLFNSPETEWDKYRLQDNRWTNRTSKDAKKYFFQYGEREWCHHLGDFYRKSTSPPVYINTTTVDSLPGGPLACVGGWAKGD